MKYANVKFNNGDGALLCNACRVIIAYGHDHEDRLHFCESCSDIFIENPGYFYHKFRIMKSQKEEADKKLKFGSNPFGCE